MHLPTIKNVLSLGFIASLLIGSALSDRAFLGYRRVPKEKAKRWSRVGVNFLKTKELLQTGKGLYLTNERDKFFPKDKEAWYCILWANAEFMEHVAKIWIPPKNDKDEPLWFQQDKKVVRKYIKSVAPEFNHRRTIKFSVREGYGDDDLQMAVPRELVRNEHIDIRAECSPSILDIPADRANYERWNITGRKL